MLGRVAGLGDCGRRARRPSQKRAYQVNNETLRKTITGDLLDQNMDTLLA
jgi:hypothetical protein